MNIKNSVIASKNWTLHVNATAVARKKFDGGVTPQSTTSTPWKFDPVSRRNSTAPGSKPDPLPVQGQSTLYMHIRIHREVSWE